jgi:hypothetical protein
MNQLLPAFFRTVRRAVAHRSPLAALVALAMGIASLGPALRAQGRDCVTIRSGPYQDISAVVGGPGAPLPAFTPASFAAAAASTTMLKPIFPLPGGWVPALTGDPLARWMGLAPQPPGNSFLLSHPFVIDGCAFANASITIEIAVASQCGDLGSFGPNPIGVYLNGNALTGFAGGLAAASTTWTATGIGTFLLPGCNRLEIYVRNTDYAHAGVMYSANLCWDAECLAREYLGIHTGNGNGTVDTEVRALPLTAAPTGPDFVAAQTAPFAAISAPPANGCMPRCNPQAKWNASPDAATLYAQPFEITACNVTSLRIRAEGAAFKFLGDPANEIAGIYVNGKAVPGSWADGLAGTRCMSGEFIALIGDCDLIANGTNWIYVYIREGVPTLPIHATALVYCARLTVTSCAQPELVGFRSGASVMMRTGLAIAPLQTTPFVWPSDFVCSTAAAVVATRPGWCPGLSGSPAQWVSSDAFRGPATTMFCQSFTVNTCKGSIGSAIMTMNFAADDDLGDFRGGGANIEGVYINGQPVTNSMTTNGTAVTCRTMVRDVRELLVTGANVFTVYCRDTLGVASGAIWDVSIDIQPCPEPAMRVGDGCLPSLASLAVVAPFELGANSGFVVGYGDLRPHVTILGLGFFAIPPIDLEAFGMPGCTLDVDFAVTSIAMMQFGQASFPLGIPDDASLTGLSVYAQALVRDPAVGGLGLVVTPAVRAIIR